MKDYALNVLNKVLGLASGLAIAVILARSLSVELRGQLGYLLSIASLAAIVSGLGVSHSFIYEFRKSQNSFYGRLSSLLLLGQASLLITASFLVAVFGQDGTLGLLLLLIAVLMLHQQFGAIMSAYKIRRRIKIGILYSGLRLATYSSLLLLNTEQIWVPLALAAVAPFFASAAHLAGVAWQSPGQVDRSSVTSTYRFGWLPMLTTLLVVLNYSVDIVMLRSLGEEVDLGLYVVAAGVITYMWLIPDSIKEVLVSRVVRSDDVSVVLGPLKVAVIASLLTIAFVAAFGSVLVPLAFGDAYRDSYRLIVILSLGTIPVVYYKILGVPLLADGRRVTYCASLSVAVLLNVLLNLWFIPRYGATGAAAVSAGTYTFTGVAFTVAFARTFDVPLRRIYLLDRSDRLLLRNMLLRS